MATILDFPYSAGEGDGRGRARAGRPSATSAEIVLFPGVRYERQQTADSAAPAPPAPPPAKARSRRAPTSGSQRRSVERDRLEILD
jgi:hypothetical protein